MLLMMIGRLLLWGLVIYLGWRYLVGRREGISTAKANTQEDQPLAMLRQRLASGEISIEEFDRIKERVDPDA